MTRKPLQVGERVKVCGYAREWETGGLTNALERTCVVISGSRDGLMVMLEDAKTGEKLHAHECQCFRLRPKRKAREWTMTFSHNAPMGWHVNGPTTAQGELVTVREVVRRKGRV